METKNILLDKESLIDWKRKFI